MKLTPNTSSPHFVEAYVTECKKAGLPPQLVADNYHQLRIKEACIISPAFREGFEKEAVLGGLFTKGLSAGLRGLWAGGMTLGRRSAPQALSKAFRNFSVMPTKTITGQPFRSPLAKDPGSIRSRLWANLQRTNATRSMAGRTLAEGALLGGGAMAMSGVNPVTGTWDAVRNALGGGVPAGGLNMPSFVSVGGDGRLRANIETGAWAQAMHLQDQMTAMDRRMQSLQAMAARADSGNVRDRVQALDAQRELSKLTRERNRVANQFSRAGGSALGTSGNFSQALAQRQKDLTAQQTRNEAYGNSLADRMSRLHGTGFGRLISGLPFIGTDAAARRSVNTSDNLQRELANLGRTQKDWEVLDSTLRTGAPGRVPPNPRRM
jgi:hypothetical protein